MKFILITIDIMALKHKIYKIGEIYEKKSSRIKKIIK